MTDSQTQVLSSAQPTSPKINIDLWQSRAQPGELIPLLQSAQESCGYVTPQAIEYISQVTGNTKSEIYGVITFYKQFRLKPIGKFLIRVCDGTACHVNDAKTLISIVEDELKLEGDDTTADGLFTLQPVACLGCCSLAPALMVNDQTYGRLTPQKVRKILKQYKNSSKVKGEKRISNIEQGMSK
ncbi:MAG: NADH dehydrogenase (Ubiquinone) flavoprotein 2 [uncultured bacterium]|nr:MAG: NADH dehydrogenase (Ubiquinone) flavoprotein 2 [uncultured bacterium]HLD43943.1 NADH-quinone oxidoreductase subunit NuoE [bacterium]